MPMVVASTQIHLLTLPKRPKATRKTPQSDFRERNKKTNKKSAGPIFGPADSIELPTIEGFHGIRIPRIVWVNYPNNWGQVVVDFGKDTIHPFTSNHQ